MGSVGQVTNYNPAFFPCAAPESWYAIHTYPRHEKKVDQELSRKGLQTYLPIINRTHQWSDRRKAVELPLFPCYTFVRMAPLSAARLQVLQSNGVIGFVGAAKQGSPIADTEIEYIQKILTAQIAVDPYPFLKIGQRVRVCAGSLAGLEGILLEKIGARKLVVSIEGIERSLAICIEGIEVEAA